MTTSQDHISKELLVLLKGVREIWTPSLISKAQVMTISPKEARYILLFCNNAKGFRNRKPSLQAVKKYAQDMTGSSWLFTGDSIVFSKEGILIQGQHRLFACIRADVALEVVVVTGVHKDAFKVLDQGINRTLGNILFSETDIQVNPTTLAQVVRLTWVFLNKKIDQPKTSRGDEICFTRSEGLALLEQRPELIDFVGRYNKAKVVTPSVAGFCYWMLSQYDSGGAQLFLDKVLLGVGLKADTIEWTLNQKLINNNNRKQGKLDRTSIIANIIIGWRKVIGLSKSRTTNTTWDVNRSPFPSPYSDEFEV